MTRFTQAAAVLLISGLGLAGCEALSEGVQSNTDVVARAGGLELTIDEAAELLSDQVQLPANPQVVEAVANLWIDYSLLSLAMHRDTSLQSYDLTPVVQQDIDQLVVYKLRDSLIRPDTALDEDELRRLYQEELPGVRVRARHILLHYPDQATDEQRDSVRELALSLKERAESGESFAALAREYSDDRGTAEEGGDLGWFERGNMVPPFEEAALATEPGEISDPVESPYGLHVIQVNDREIPRFEEIRREFRARVVNERVAAAESAYVAGVEEPAGVTVRESAHQVVRELARRPQMRLSSRAADRALTEYEGGEVTAGEFQQYLAARPPGFRRQLVSGDDRRIEVLLRGLTRAELLVNEAEAEGLEATESERDSLRLLARNQVVQAARTLGLWPVDPEAGEPLEDAIHRSVKSVLDEMLKGEQDVLMMGNIGFTLRQNFRATVFEHTFSRVVDRVQQIKPGAPGRPKVQPLPGGPTTQGPRRAPNAPPDTTGG